MNKRFGFIVLFFLLIFHIQLQPYWSYRGKGVKWGVTAHLIALVTHTIYREHMKANLISAGSLSFLYLWDNLVNEYYEPCHRRNFYYILAGHAGGWFCGKQLRSVLEI